MQSIILLRDSAYAYLPCAMGNVIDTICPCRDLSLEEDAGPRTPLLRNPPSARDRSSLVPSTERHSAHPGSSSSSSSSANHLSWGGLDLPRDSKREEDDYLLLRPCGTYWIENNATSDDLKDMVGQRLIVSEDDATFKERTVTCTYYVDAFGDAPHIHFVGTHGKFGLVAISVAVTAQVDESEKEAIALQYESLKNSPCRVTYLVRWNRGDDIFHVHLSNAAALLPISAALSPYIPFSSSATVDSPIRRSPSRLSKPLEREGSITGLDDLDINEPGKGEFAETSIPGQLLNHVRLLRLLGRRCPDLTGFRPVYTIDEAHSQYNLLGDALRKFEQEVLVKQIKAGVLYCREDQVEELEMYANNEGSAGYEEFLDLLGDEFTVDRVSKPDEYTGLLRDGQRARHTAWGGMEIVWHVATLLPFDKDSNQQIERKRHLGNDTVVIVYVDGQQQLRPEQFLSKVNLCYIFVRPVGKEGYYYVSVATKSAVNEFPPPVPHRLMSGQALRDLVILKTIRGHMESFRSEKYKHYWRARECKLQEIQEKLLGG